MSTIRRKEFCYYALLTAMLGMTSLKTEATELFSDNFDRSSGTLVGNGWFEKSWYSSAQILYEVDGVSILDNRLRFSTSNDFRNVDAGIVRPLVQVCGVVVSGTVEWINANRNVGLSLAVNAGASNLTYDGLMLVISPDYRGSDFIYISNGGPAFLTELVQFDFSLPNHFEWAVKDDCSTDVRVWPVNQVRPQTPLVSSAPVTPIPRANPQLEVMATGGTGCCRYAPYDLRLDNLLVTRYVEGMADAGPDQSVNEGVMVTLDGSASITPQAPISYNWFQIAGPPVTLNGASSATPTFTAPVVNSNVTLAFDLLVGSGDFVSAPDVVNITVVNTNTPPVADAGADNTAKEGALAHLNGTYSYDSDNEPIAAFYWTQASGPSVTLIGASSANPSFTAPPSGGTAVTLSLVVSDGKELSQADTVVVTVVPNSRPVADAGNDITKDESSTVVLSGILSHDPDASDTLAYHWAQISGLPVVLSSTTAAEPTFVAPTVNAGGSELVFELVVTDNDPVYPLASLPARVTVTIRNQNDPPSCHLASASPSILWPPNHGLAQINILGLADPDPLYNAVELTIVGVTQDEPINGLGDGDSGPDAVLQASEMADNVALRAERAGNRNGRVYRIAFTASDGFESCAGTVDVSVPLTRKGAAVDDGQGFNSLQP